MTVLSIAEHQTTPRTKGDGFSLRPIDIGDSELLRAWRIAPETSGSFPQAKITRESHAGWLERHLRGCDGWMWIIERDDETETPMGSITIVRLNEPVWEIGRVVIAPEFRGSLWGRKAISACVEIAKEHGHASMVEVMPHNGRMLALCKSLGFTETPIQPVSGLVRLKTS